MTPQYMTQQDLDETIAQLARAYLRISNARLILYASEDEAEQELRPIFSQIKLLHLLRVAPVQSNDETRALALATIAQLTLALQQLRSTLETAPRATVDPVQPCDTSNLVSYIAYILRSARSHDEIIRRLETLISQYHASSG